MLNACVALSTQCLIMWKGQVIMLNAHVVLYTQCLISSPEQRSRRAVVLTRLRHRRALVVALVSTNVKVFIKVLRRHCFLTLSPILIRLWYDYTYWSKILHSTIPTTLGHVKVKVTDLEFSC